MMRVCQSLIASQALADYTSLNTIAIVRLLAAQIAENVRHMLRVECCASAHGVRTAINVIDVQFLTIPSERLP